uniref:Uncharacterized protein n=1 Tax=Schistocephalus solidus TaxID=70667 RepID=A0A0X3PW27_SCHSO
MGLLGHMHLHKNLRQINAGPNPTTVTQFLCQRIHHTCTLPSPPQVYTSHVSTKCVLWLLSVWFFSYRRDLRHTHNYLRKSWSNIGCDQVLFDEMCGTEAQVM